MFDEDYMDLTEIIEIYLETIPLGFVAAARRKKKGPKLIPQLKSYFQSINIDYIETEDNLFIKKCNAIIFTNFYKSFNVDDYYSTVQASKLLGCSTHSFSKRSKWFQQFHTIFYRALIYFYKHEIDDYIKMKHKHNLVNNKPIPAVKTLPVLSGEELCAIKNGEYLDKTALVKLSRHNGYQGKSTTSILSSLKFHFEHMKISYIETEDNLYIKKCDADIYINFINNFDIDEYYNANQVADLLGTKHSNVYTTIRHYIQSVFYKGLVYYPKIKVDHVVKLKAETRPIVDLKKELGVTIGRIKSTINQLKSEHPFGNYCLIKGYDEVKQRLHREKELASISDRLQYYQELTKELRNKNELCPQTLLDFDDYVGDRCNTTKEKVARHHTELYKKLSMHLRKEHLEYSEEELARLASQMHLNYKQGHEFHLFLDYCNEKYNNVLPRSKFKTNREKQDKSYTVQQWDRFQLLVFGSSIDDMDYIQKALRSRTLAMTWCYFALHFVTIWRKGDIQSLPFPNLQLIGFQDGHAFLDYLRRNIVQTKIKDLFTETMGEIICNDISLRMKTQSEKASKNGGLLRFIVGESMVRQVGLLLVICEAHRQLVKDSNSNSNSTQLITNSVVLLEYHLELFEDKYKEIFLNEKFNNKIASATSAKEVSEKGGNKGLWLSAVLRGNKALPGVPSSTMANIYIKHAYQNNRDTSLDVITFNLFERGVFSSFPYMLLGVINNNFKKIDYQKQTQLIQELELAPLEVESMTKMLMVQQRDVSILIDKMIRCGKSQIKATLLTLLFGDAHSKHHYVKCLFRAIHKHYSKEVIEGISFSEIEEKCIYPDSPTCFGCPFMIAEKWFLLELSERLWDIVQKVKSAKTEREKLKYQALLNILKRILFEAIPVLGTERINAYISQTLIHEVTVLEDVKIRSIQTEVVT